MSKYSQSVIENPPRTSQKNTLPVKHVLHHPWGSSTNMTITFNEEEDGRWPENKRIEIHLPTGKRWYGVIEARELWHKYIGMGWTPSQRIVKIEQ